MGGRNSRTLLDVTKNNDLSASQHASLLLSLLFVKTLVSQAPERQVITASLDNPSPNYPLP